jgi:sugar-specific transcriptional regulator TrmB
MSAHLTELEALLRRGQYTAKELAKRTGCSIPTAYARLRRLQENGVDVFELRSKTGKRPGPRATVYGIR